MRGRHASDLRPQLLQFLLDTFVTAIDVIDAIDNSLTLGNQPGDDQAGRGAQIGGLTGAPVSCLTPVENAVLPFRSILAPMRCSSCTCMKRFSNTVSVMVPEPLAIEFNTENCACMSVGNAG